MSRSRERRRFHARPIPAWRRSRHGTSLIALDRVVAAAELRASSSRGNYCSMQAKPGRDRALSLQWIPPPAHSKEFLLLLAGSRVADHRYRHRGTDPGTAEQRFHSPCWRQNHCRSPVWNPGTDAIWPACMSQASGPLDCWCLLRSVPELVWVIAPGAHPRPGADGRRIGHCPHLQRDAGQSVRRDSGIFGQRTRPRHCTEKWQRPAGRLVLWRPCPPSAVRAGLLHGLSLGVRDPRLGGHGLCWGRRHRPAHGRIDENAGGRRSVHHAARFPAAGGLR
jgi:hypothetical protein